MCLIYIYYGTDVSTSRRKLAGLGISCISPQTSTISSTEVAGNRSSWKVERTREVDLRSVSSLWRIHSARVVDHSDESGIKRKQSMYAFGKEIGCSVTYYCIY